MKTWKLTVNEEELKALINFHLSSAYNDSSIERSQRIHDLTKRLNRDTPEIEGNPKPSNEPETKDGW